MLRVELQTKPMLAFIRHAESVRIIQTKVGLLALRLSVENEVHVNIHAYSNMLSAFDSGISNELSSIY